MFMPNEISSALHPRNRPASSFARVQDRLDGAARRVRRAEIARRLAQRVRDRLPDLVGHLRAAGRVEEREPGAERREPLARGLGREIDVVIGVSPVRMRVSTARSMLPPDTMQTIFLAPETLPDERRRDRERARAFRDDARALGEQPHRRSYFVERNREARRRAARDACSQTRGISSRLPEPSTNDGTYSTAVGVPPAASVAAHRRAGLGLGRVELHLGPLAP